jgi:hypothetical protein
MKNPARYLLMVALAGVLAFTAWGWSGAEAPKWKIVDEDAACDGGWFDRSARACEVREATIEADWDRITVDGGLNGGIGVEGWSKNEIRVRAKVKAWDRDEEAARETLRQIEIKTDRQRIVAKGPKLKGSRRGWAVGFEVMVPRESNLDLETHNGGISIEDVSGEIEAEAVNGGLTLTQLAGDVNVHTTNGSVAVELQGKKWQGHGLDATTTNGAIKVWIPEDYNADLETGTVNGSVDFDFPVTVQGRISKRVRATLGHGGPRVRLVTTNGGVTLKQF